MSESIQSANSDGNGEIQFARRRRNSVVARVVTVLVLVALTAIAWWQLSQHLNIDQLVNAETWLRNQADNRPVLCGLIAFLTYVVVTGLSLPFALLLTIMISWLLGFGWSLVVISFGSTIGATLAMLASRHVLRDWVRHRTGQRFGEVLLRLDQEGGWYLASMRLAPVVPFFVVNLLAGLTRVRVRDYFWISQLCMLPTTAVYTWVGASLPGLKQLSQQGPGTLVSRSLILGLCGMAILPPAIRFFLRHSRSEKTGDPLGTGRPV